MELGADDKLVTTGGEPGRLDREVFKVDCLDLGVLLAIDLRKRHIALKRKQLLNNKNCTNLSHNTLLPATKPTVDRGWNSALEMTAPSM